MSEYDKFSFWMMYNTILWIDFQAYFQKYCDSSGHLMPVNEKTQKRHNSDSCWVHFSPCLTLWPSYQKLLQLKGSPLHRGVSLGRCNPSARDEMNGYVFLILSKFQFCLFFIGPPCIISTHSGRKKSWNWSVKYYQNTAFSNKMPL